MVQVDIPAAFAMGQVFAIVAKKTLRREPSYTANYFLTLTNWYTALILAPTGFFLLVGWPGWETMYQWEWVEKTHFNPWVSLFYIFFLIILVVLGSAGFIMTHRFLRNGKDKLAKTILKISVVGTLAPFLIDIKAPFYIGTYQEYHSGNADTVIGSAFFWSWLFIMLYWVIGSVLMVIKVYWEDKFKQHQIVGETAP